MKQLMKDSVTLEESDHLDSRTTLNIGPSHPATHGVIRFFLELDSEIIEDCEVDIGYLHRGFEISGESVPWTQVIPYTDRLNYLSAILNNIGYCKAVEEMCDIEIPKRAKYLRVIAGELSRISDHLVNIGTQAVDLGAMTNFWYFFEAREEIYELIESLCGARLTNCYTRIGGVAYDLPDGWADKCERFVDDRLPSIIDDVDHLLTRNRIFMDRTVGVGAIDKDEAISYSYTGPALRACGVPYDIRKVKPYHCYGEFDFDVPTFENGDVYDRYRVRMEEMRQSISIIKQALDNLPYGPVKADAPKYVLPDKDEVYTKMEAMIRHFKIEMEGIQVPEGKHYSCTEAANGELGFYIISDGSGIPYRVRCRPPCFPLLSSMEDITEGSMVSDLIATLASLNVIAGELER